MGLSLFYSESEHGWGGDNGANCSGHSASWGDGLGWLCRIDGVDGLDGGDWLGGRGRNETGDLVVALDSNLLGLPFGVGGEAIGSLLEHVVDSVELGVNNGGSSGSDVGDNFDITHLESVIGSSFLFSLRVEPGGGNALEVVGFILENGLNSWEDPSTFDTGGKSLIEGLEVGNRGGSTDLARLNEVVTSLFVFSLAESVGPAWGGGLNWFLGLIKADTENVSLNKGVLVPLPWSMGHKVVWVTKTRSDSLECLVDNSGGHVESLKLGNSVVSEGNRVVDLGFDGLPTVLSFDKVDWSSSFAESWSTIPLGGFGKNVGSVKDSLAGNSSHFFIWVFDRTIF